MTSAFSCPLGKVSSRALSLESCAMKDRTFTPLFPMLTFRTILIGTSTVPWKVSDVGLGALVAGFTVMQDDDLFIESFLFSEFVVATLLQKHYTNNIGENFTLFLLKHFCPNLGTLFFLLRLFSTNCSTRRRDGSSLRGTLLYSFLLLLQ